MIKFSCKNCGQNLNVEDKHSGKKVKCPKCGSIRVIPNSSDKIIFNCKNCGQKISIPLIHAGKKGKCPKCQNIVIFPIHEAIPAESRSLILPNTDESLYHGEAEESEESEIVNYRLILLISGAAVVIVVGLIILAIIIRPSESSPIQETGDLRGQREVVDRDIQMQPTINNTLKESIPTKEAVSEQNMLMPGQMMENSIGMKLVYIPLGEFIMGSPSSEPVKEPDEVPQHRVRFNQGFWMGICEVTVKYFEVFINATDYHTEAEIEGTSSILKDGSWKKLEDISWRDPGFGQTDDSPVVCVSWNDAMAFCNWLSKKEGRTYILPSEAEWEYACRAGSAGKYCFGDNDLRLSEYAWYGSNSDGKTHSVCEKQANAFGLYDIHGNVWEWCADWYASNYYAHSPEIEPQGPGRPGQYRNMRGGSWTDPPRYCRSADRKGLPPNYHGVSVGFRVLLRSEYYSNGPIEIGPNKISGPERSAELSTNELVQSQLKMYISLSQVSPQMTFEEAVEFISNTVIPKLNIKVRWEDFSEKSGVSRTTPVRMEAVPLIRLGDALDQLVRSVSGSSVRIGYVVSNGGVIIAPTESLQRK